MFVNKTFLKHYLIAALPALFVGVLQILEAFNIIPKAKEYMPQQYIVLFGVLMMCNFLFYFWCLLFSIDYPGIKLKFYGYTKFSAVFSYPFLIIAVLAFHKGMMVECVAWTLTFMHWEYNRRSHNKKIEDIELKKTIEAAKTKEEVQIS